MILLQFTAINSARVYLKKSERKLKLKFKFFIGGEGGGVKESTNRI